MHSRKILISLIFYYELKQSKKIIIKIELAGQLRMALHPTRNVTIRIISAYVSEVQKHYMK